MKQNMEANGQTVLVTGGTGFVGKILTKKLYKENYKVVVFSKVKINELLKIMRPFTKLTT